MSGDLPLWRSLDEIGIDRAALLEAEFPALFDAANVDRRMALRLMGASLALAAVSGCGRPGGDPLPGGGRSRPVDYATTLDRDGHGFGVVVRTVDGRPIKIEGNPLHPASLGGSDVFAQVELLSLYDPDRSRIDWTAARRMLAGWRRDLVERRGRGLHVLVQPTASPTRDRLIALVRALLPEARWHSHRPIGDGNARAGARLAFGRPLDTIARFDRADVIVSLGADFLGPGPAQVRHARDLIERRRRDGPQPLLIVAESTSTLTGARADRRLPMAPRDIARFAATLAGDPALAGRNALVLAGRDQPPDVHALAHALSGATVDLIEPVIDDSPFESIAALADAMATGAASDLIVLGGNPAYDAPVDLAFADRLGRVPRSLHLGEGNGTARTCRAHLPIRDRLESWGDARAFDGTASIVQPASVPLQPGLSEIELLALIAGERANGRVLVRETWRDRLGDEQWLLAVERGVIEGSAAAPVSASPARPAPIAVASERRGLTLVLRPDATIWDGRFANNAWAQELPDPVTKLVWGNALTIAPETAALFEVENGDVVEVVADGRRLTVPVWIAPGQARDTIALALGYGRRDAGRVGDRVGVDAYQLRASDRPWSIEGVSIRKTGAHVRLVSAQGHHPVGDRQPVRFADPLAAVEVEPPAPPPPSFYPEPERSGRHQWGMVIDLDACIGCGACTVACQAENNIPVVGADEAARGRLMHWLRVDRYHQGTPENPVTAFQPVPCMHCETAPCEPVCPVAATTHSSEGLNEMTYNRCIGTRTCSNNCPYKVRRFNWFDYSEEGRGPAPNPSVTVRSRGVMEKCTYCVQRIEASREGDGPPVTACQQACPTRAIAFGDIADATSDVAAAKRNPRNYALLGDLNLKPRTTYLARRGPREP